MRLAFARAAAGDIEQAREILKAIERQVGWPLASPGMRRRARQDEWSTFRQAPAEV